MSWVTLSKPPPPPSSLQMIYFSIETGNFTDFFRDCPQKRRDEIEARMYVSCVLMLIAKSFEPIKNKFFMCWQETGSYAAVAAVCGGGRGAKLKIKLHEPRFLFILSLHPDCAGKSLLRLAASSSRVKLKFLCHAFAKSVAWQLAPFTLSVCARCVTSPKSSLRQFTFTFMFTRDLRSAPFDIIRV